MPTSIVSSNDTAVKARDLRRSDPAHHLLLQFMLSRAFVQMMRHCRKHLLLHLIPSPSGFFVAGLEGGGPRDEKSQRRRCTSSRFLSQRGIQSGGCIYV